MAQSAQRKQGGLTSAPLQLGPNFLNGLQGPQQDLGPEPPIEQVDPEPSLGQIDMEDTLDEHLPTTDLFRNYIDITGPFHSGDRNGCSHPSYTATTGLVSCNLVAAGAVPGTWTGTRQAYSEAFPVGADLQNVPSNINKQIVSVVQMIHQLVDAFLHTSDITLSYYRIRSLPGSLGEIQPNVDELLQSIPDSFAHIRCNLPLYSLFRHNGISVRRIVAHLSVGYFCSPWRKTRRWNRNVRGALCVDWFMTLQPEDETQFDDPFPDNSEPENCDTHLPDTIALSDDGVPAPTADTTPSPVTDNLMDYDDQPSFTPTVFNYVLRDIQLDSDHDLDADNTAVTDRAASLLDDTDVNSHLPVPLSRSPSLILDAASIASMGASIFRDSPEPIPCSPSTLRFGRQGFIVSHTGAPTPLAFAFLDQFLHPLPSQEPMDDSGTSSDTFIPDSDIDSLSGTPLELEDCTADLNINNDDSHLQGPNAKLVKKFPCIFEGCDKSYPKRSNLEDHMSVHDETKRFLCSICNREFRRYRDRDRHKKIQHQHMRWRCDHCPRTLTRKPTAEQKLGCPGTGCLHIFNQVQLIPVPVPFPVAVPVQANVPVPVSIHASRSE
ncbi:MAG: hypothetical protein J3R72DRAFT_100663 [Linnemannia gamsii]|nr:MAG: hypothetical protein J3R72DRAFT_100663 [Linnemannia gamsii]